MGDGCGYPGCDWQGAHRPYARRRDAIPSASAIASLADDQTGMRWAAAGITASMAVHQPERWREFNTHGCDLDKKQLCAACRFLRSEHDRRWKAKAALGSHVHHLIADLAAGMEVEATPDVDGYLDGWDKFVIAHWPEWVLLERTVLSDRDLPYRGTIDAVVNLTVDGEREGWLVDWKTGRFHAWSQTLQLAGYRYAEHITKWDDGVETVVDNMPKVRKAGVVLLDGAGGFRLQELPADDRAYSAFMKLRAVWEFQRTIKAWERDNEK